MPDLGSISTAIATIKTSMEIAKLIKDSNSSLDEAETKLKLAELISSLADLKTELADIKVDLIDKDDEIRDLKKKLQDKSTITFDDNIYWKEIDGKKEGPFCPTCFDVNELSVRLHKDGPGWWCKNCQDHFGESTKY
jgi:ribosome-associated protein YbcJ (S4-like RNA binding protein)